ncbi:lycopene cyclase domain-containing protein [Paeniglutamicibacter cryotolerans]|uniref:Lycopene cyclase domain-containing protein n=1 Tax=Paeniglutamicibacter cryotolerans TaxID=670079 RepID=A0A839QIP6_9MICC|nr:lycopene cyclase domain-containing protein [Paeniglutamicibacter cryotolerans]MBB2994614.1 lycopene cyclase domain-containing protein [Paeniglutamicibacter cryotolerans]
MSFIQLDVIFLLIAALVLAVACIRRRVDRTALWAIVASMLILCVLTAVFDNVMIGVGLFEYASAPLAGIRLGLAPIEDFAYPIGAALLLPGLWLLLTKKGGARR